MGQKAVTFFQVGNGNCCLVEYDDFRMVFDLNGTEEKNSWELLSPFFRKSDNKLYLDVLCVSHGDEDHCKNFQLFKKQLDKENLIIGSILHTDYDRTINEDIKDLPDEYLALKEVIDQRKELDSSEYGKIESTLSCGDNENDAFEGIDFPDGIKLKVISPFSEDDEDDWDNNDLSLIINFDILGLTFLFTGDSSSKIWQNRVLPDALIDEQKDWAKAKILIASHHGSFAFFGENRDDVRDNSDEPDNYNSLKFINPSYLIVSACDKFPTSGDSSGDQPPHYAAWKWYFKWFKENYDLKKDDKHPKRFLYTSNGHIRFEYNDDSKKWKINKGWKPDDIEKGFKRKNKKDDRPGKHYA